jgi:tetratricopeptide (TPR) repeat protein
LEIVYPQTKIEIVNLAMTAVNSYTIRDLLPGVLEQKPDAILVYTGHNEYYGALGAGSMESLGRSRTFVNLVLSLKKYKSFELLTNIIQRIYVWFSDSKQNKGTLMSRMAKEKFIPLNSETFNLGLEQFEGNMRDVIEWTKAKNVPIIFGTLASNLKDLKPFISKRTDSLPPASDVFNAASAEYSNGNYNKADSLFRYAKDLDMLRFRAPEKINEIIANLCSEYELPLVNIDSIFASESEHGITGNNLMTDHLHPKLRGYQIIGKAFTDKLYALDIKPKGMHFVYKPDFEDKLTIRNFKFSPLDSIASYYRIKILKNDFPYTPPGKKLSWAVLLHPSTFIDSLAYRFLRNDITWEKAHRLAARRYLANNDIDNYWEYMDLIVTQYPILYGYYTQLANELMQHGKYNDSYIYLKKQYDIKPSAFNTKWMGIIALSHKNIKEAIPRFEESIKLNDKDAQVYYNLAGAYTMEKKYKLALDIIVKALEINPEYTEAKALYEQLKNYNKKAGS